MAERAGSYRLVGESPGTIVVALGGNALAPAGASPTIASQFAHTRTSLEAVVNFAREGWNIAIVHGNGPQVGDELDRNEMAHDVLPPLPLGVLVAATAGWIGYMIQQSLKNALVREGVERDVITLITQTEVSKDDDRMHRPTKPIGHTLSEERKQNLEARGEAVGKDGKGRWRRMAPSPTPVSVLESSAVAQLVGEGKIVIACGGGGPPVYCDETGAWEGLDAVIDKDLTAAVLAHDIGASTFLILTDVDGVYRDWGTDAQERIREIMLEEAVAMLDDRVLSEGSMRPKVAAATRFLKGGGERAIIAHLADGAKALTGETGTTIRRHK